MTNTQKKKRTKKKKKGRTIGFPVETAAHSTCHHHPAVGDHERSFLVQAYGERRAARRDVAATEGATKKRSTHKKNFAQCSPLRDCGPDWLRPRGGADFWDQQAHSKALKPGGWSTHPHGGLQRLLNESMAACARESRGGSFFFILLSSHDGRHACWRSRWSFLLATGRLSRDTG